MANNDGGPAFPMPYSTDEHSQPCNATLSDPGMSLRDAFAISVSGEVYAKYTAPPVGSNYAEYHFAEIAREIWAMADAMIAEKSK